MLRYEAMAKLPTEAKAERVIKVFERVGFVRQGRKSGTSHEVLKRPGPRGTLSVRHPTLRKGLLRTLIRDAGMELQEFMELYEHT